MVTAIVVNWNGASDLQECLPTLRAQDYPFLDIIVVDNGSSDESESVVARHEARWLALGRNRGLAAALHEGAQASSGQNLLFLNNDMAFAPDFVSRLVEALDAHPDAFAVDARQVDWQGRTVIHSKTFLVRDEDSTHWSFPGWRVAQEDTDAVAPCAFPTAANVMVRADRYREIGGWDTRFPIAFEDTDLSLRAWAHGYASFYVPGAIARHDVSASARSEEGARLRRRGETIGVLILAQKHLPMNHVFGSAWSVVRACVGSAFRGRWPDARMLAGALGRGLAATPGALRERRRLARASGLTAQGRLEAVASAVAPDRAQ